MSEREVSENIVNKIRDVFKKYGINVEGILKISKGKLMLEPYLLPYEVAVCNLQLPLELLPKELRRELTELLKEGHRAFI